MKKTNQIMVQGQQIGVKKIQDNDYISITDIAKRKNIVEPRYVIQNWMKSRNTIEFLSAWEHIFNPVFNRVEFDAFKNDSGSNSFYMTPQKWIESTNAIGIISKSGRYGGTYAHKDTEYIEQGLDQEERYQRFKRIIIRQIKSLENKNFKKLEK